MFKILKEDKEELYCVAEDVPKGFDVSELLDNMWETMNSKKGCGLAGNQVGELKRVFVMEAGGCCLEIINPIITKKFCGKKLGMEGCLSFPEKQKMVLRYDRIILEGFDRNWNPIKKKMSKFSARCAQHEIDHLNGKTIF